MHAPYGGNHPLQANATVSAQSSVPHVASATVVPVPTVDPTLPMLPAINQKVPITEPIKIKKPNRKITPAAPSNPDVSQQLPTVAPTTPTTAGVSETPLKPSIKTPGKRVVSSPHQSSKPKVLFSPDTYKNQETADDTKVISETIDYFEQWDAKSLNDFLASDDDDDSEWLPSPSPQKKRPKKGAINTRSGATKTPYEHPTEEEEYIIDSEQWFSKKVDAQLTQYTTIYSRHTPSASAMIEDQTAVSQAVSSVTSQDPDGVGWIDWTGSEWNGIPIDTTGLSKGEIWARVFPQNANAMLGLREYFYQVNPFQDVTNPTVAEIDNWNLHIVKHFRNILGSTVPVELDEKLFVRARWSDERKYTNVWDDVPGTFDSAFGPCIGGTNQHCGDAFYPPLTDQPPYLSQYTPTIAPFSTTGDGTTGMGTTNANIPWCVKLTRIISAFLSADGLGAHTGPFLTRTKFGYTFWRFNQWSVVFRGKWS